MEWYPILSESFWMIKIDKLTVKNNNKNVNNIKNNDILIGIVDTGTSFIIMDQKLIHNLFNGKIKMIEKDGLYIVPYCNKNAFPNIMITIENQNYILSKYDYVFQTDIKNVCLLGFMSLNNNHKSFMLKYKNKININNNHNNIIILGAIFIKKFPTTFDYDNKKIGFLINM